MLSRIPKMNEPRKCVNTIAALTKTVPVEEARIMAAAILLRVLREVKSRSGSPGCAAYVHLAGRGAR